MRQWIITILAAAALIGAGEAARADSANVIDYHRTGSGASTPFTASASVAPTPWHEFMMPAVTYPTESRPWLFEEPAMGNTTSVPFGRLLFDDGYWVVMDILAWVPNPHVLYVVPEDDFFIPESLPETAAAIEPLVVGDLPRRASPPANDIPEVPEPATLLLAAAGVAVMGCRRPRRKPS